MLDSFPHVLRRYGLDVDVRVLLELFKTMEMGLVSNLGSLFDVGQHLIVKARRDIAPYTMAFWDYFLGIEVAQYRTVDEAIHRSSAFEQWYSQKLETGQIEQEVDRKKLVDQFLNEVLQSDLRANIQKELDARELLDKDNPDRADQPDDGSRRPPKMNENRVDYAQIPLEELMERMKKVAAQQKSPHHGGSHWIGTHGVSPYGHSGHGLNGIRVGGASYAGSARKVLADPQYFHVDTDAHLTDDNMDVAFQALKHVVDHHLETKLDVEKTVQNTGKNAGILFPYFKKEKQDLTQVMLLLDNGGNSMVMHTRQIQRLFSKIKRRFTHDLKTYYFHNTIYDQVYEDESRRTSVALGKLLEHTPDFKVFIVGDAHMGPHEVFSPYGAIEHREESKTPSIENLQALRQHFPHMVWINPIDQKYWSHTVASVIQKIIPMEPLTIHGIVKAVQHMNSKLIFS
ncbi:hypothetical protein WDW89_20730 [Deltaproteobacteria bacterium TL4]